MLLALKKNYLFTGPILIALLVNFTPTQGGYTQSATTERCAANVCYIEITESGFSPQELIVEPGSIVIWKNVNQHIHMIKSGSPENQTNLFDSDLLERNEAHGFAFMEEHLGSHEYYDLASIHSGKIIVEEQVSSARNLQININDPSSGVRNVEVNGRITSIEIDPEHSKLIIALQDQTVADHLEITLDRQLVDARVEGRDVSFAVFVDGQQANYVEEAHSTAQGERTLSIPLPENSRSVEIFGTHLSTELLGHDDAQLALDEARNVIAEYRQAGIIVTSSENMLLEAQRAFDSGRYSFAEYLAERAVNNAHITNTAALAASRALAEAESSISHASYLGLNVENSEESIAQIEQKYASGEYEDALRIAMQVNADASSRLDTFYIILSIILASGVAVAMQVRFKFIWRIQQAATATTTTTPIATGTSSTTATATMTTIDANSTTTDNDMLEQILAEKRHLRESDKEVLRYIFERNGVTLSEIRKRFGLPTSSSWRLAKRLEREELVEIEKVGNQNHVRFVQGRY